MDKVIETVSHRTERSATLSHAFLEGERLSRLNLVGANVPECQPYKRHIDAQWRTIKPIEVTE
jgi:hypothetical protein